MALVRFNNGRDTSLPSLFDSLARDLFDLTNTSSPGTSMPAVNIKETKEDFQVEVAAPGMKKEDFKIRLDHNILSISSERENNFDEKDQQGNYTRREFSYQSFQRSFTLPNTVEADKIVANYSDGILRLSIPKREEAKQKPPRNIEIS
jgi:HSP20 family protein